MYTINVLQAQAEFVIACDKVILATVTIGGETSFITETSSNGVAVLVFAITALLLCSDDEVEVGGLSARGQRSPGLRGMSGE